MFLIHEPFHRQDFFFINYVYKNSYQTLSAKYNNLIVIEEDECYIGQPYSGYALRKEKGSEAVVIFGVLIQTLLLEIARRFKIEKMPMRQRACPNRSLTIWEIIPML